MESCIDLHAVKTDWVPHPLKPSENVSECKMSAKPPAGQGSNSAVEPLPILKAVISEQDVMN